MRNKRSEHYRLFEGLLRPLRGFLTFSGARQDDSARPAPSFSRVGYSSMKDLISAAA
jgi:hypothetical protein